MKQQSRLRFFIALLLLACSSVFAAQSAADRPVLNFSFLRGRVFLKSGSESLYALTIGKTGIVNGASVLTFADGIAVISVAEHTELRMREDSTMAFPASNSYELRKGMIGIKHSGPISQLATPHVMTDFTETLAVIKCTPILTRICVIKGSMNVWQGRNLEKITLRAGQEIAAGQGRLSQPYPFTDDLRYAWYWTDPDKEPSLQ